MSTKYIVAVKFELYVVNKALTQLSTIRRKQVCSWLQTVAKGDDNGIVVLKWRETEDVRILPTKDAPIMSEIQRTLKYFKIKIFCFQSGKYF